MAFTKVAPAGIGSTPGDGYRIGDSFLHSTGVELTNINATGILTAASLDISGAIDFDGQTNLDHVSIAGVTTTTDDIIIGADNKKLKLGAGEELQLYQAGNHSIIQHNGGHYLLLRANAFAATSADGTKNMFAGFPDTFSSMYYNGSYKIRTQNTGAEIVGTVVATGADINGDIDVDGHTNLDNVSVSGVSTFSGVVRVPNGSAGAPAIHFGDSDSGVYGDASNGVRLTAGGSDTIVATTNGVTFPPQATALTSLTLGSQSALSKPLYFADAASVQSASILLDNSSQELRIKNGRFSGQITFTTYNTEKLRINSSGQVGIGTDDPEANAKLDIWGDGSSYPTLRLGTEIYQTEGEDIRFGRTDHGVSDIRYHSITSFHDASGSANYLKFKVHDGGSSPFQSQATVLTLLGDGKVGINDTAPERTVDIKGSNCMIQLEGTASGRQWSLCSTDNATGTAVDGGPSGSFVIYDDTDGQARLRIDSNGNARFLVTGGSFTAEGTGAYGMSIHNHNSPSMGHLFIYGDNGLIRFRNTSNTYTAQMGYTESSNTLFFANQEGGTTMYITGDGVKLYDNNKFLCGNDNDLGIYHDNSNAYIENTSGSIYFRHSGSNKVEMKSAGGIKFHNQASGNFIQYSNSTVAPNAAINLQRYGNGYCDMRLSSNYGAKVLLAGASDNTDEFVMQQGNTKEAYINNEATGKHINIQIGGTTKLQIGDDAESVRVSGTSADHTGTTGQSKGLTLQYGGGYSVPLYFGNETDSAQKSMYLHGYWIYLRGHQNEGVRFVFSQGAGNAIRSEKYQFKYNSCLNANNSTTWNTSSDARAKENVQTITNGIEIIKKLRPVTYDWTNDYADSQTMYIMGRDENGGTVAKKENGYDTDRKNGQMGFIAQEYETVLPKDVMKDTYKLGETELDDFRTMTNDSLLPSLTAALKEAIAKIEVLEAEVAALKGS